ncbi:MAG TPA: hypothetical protein VH877_19000 [Polyangia bacterium]|nr:hypothetical protein [Polyangia bacterium]
MERTAGATSGVLGLPALALGLGALALGQALQVSNGHVDPVAIRWLSLALALALVGVVRPRLPWRGSQGPRGGWERLVDLALTGGALWQLWQLGQGPPAVALTHVSAARLHFFYGGFVVAAALVCLVWVPRLQWAAGVGLLLVHFGLGAVLIGSGVDPHIDVYMIHRESLAALLDGRNPYTLTFPNIYSSTVMYGPEQLAGGRLNFGYCYPPLSLFLGLPGHLLGDYRYSLLGAMTLSGAMLMDLGRGRGSVGTARTMRTGTLAAAALLYTPRIFYVLEHGWTDSLVACLLVATIWTAVRAKRLLPVVLGLFVAAKQYTFLGLPALGLLLPGRRPAAEQWRLVVVAVLVAAGVTLPLMLWDVRRFVWDVLVLQFYSPFRADALSYLAWVARTSGHRLPSLVGFLALVPVLGLGLWRGARTPAGGAAVVGCTYLVFFAFNKQAFANYYFFCLTALLAAVSAAAVERDES